QAGGVHSGGPGPARRDPRRDRGTLGRVGDGGGEELFERHRSESLVQGPPARPGAGHGHRRPAVRGDGGGAGGRLERERGGRPAGRVQTVEALAVPHDGEQIAADVVGTRRNDRVRDRRGQGGVDRIASGPEDRQTRGGGERLA